MMKKLPIKLKILILTCLMYALFETHAQQTFRATDNSTPIGFLEYLPQDYDSNSNKYPLVIFLHGLGERGPDTNDIATIESKIGSVAVHGPAKHVKNGAQFPFILISPHLKDNYNDWNASYVLEVLDHVKTYLRIDERKIYITGLSLGGGGTWTLAQDYTTLFAAAAPICGHKNNTSKASQIAAENLPIWAFHGDEDGTVKLSKSVNMVDAINACSPVPNPKAIMTIYPGVGHNSWNKAYATDHSSHSPNIYEWMMSYTNELNAGNKIPLANAGADLVKTGNSFTIKGSGADADGSISTYTWTKIVGPDVDLQDDNSAKVSISNATAGTYIFKLRVTDNGGDSDSDYVKVTVEQGSASNVAPIANAGKDISVTLPASTFSITGSATDSDGSIASYSWTKISGPAVTLTSANTSTVSISDLEAGVYTIRFTVTDNAKAVTTDDVIVTAVAGNSSPTVDAGDDVEITLPLNSVTLLGSATDTDGTVASYTWNKISGGEATLSGATTDELVLSDLTAGSYTFGLTATDDDGAETTDNISVTVFEEDTTNNLAPIVDVGEDALLSLPAYSAFYTSTATDPDGSIASYQWIQLSGPTVKLSNASTAKVKLSQFTQESGVIVLRLTVTDNEGATAYADKNIILNYKPVADAGPDVTVKLPTSSVELYGSGSDIDGSIQSYKWRQKSGPKIKVSNDTKATLYLSELVEGEYSFRLSVVDNNGVEHVDYTTLVVEANATPASIASTDTLPTQTGEVGVSSLEMNEPDKSDITFWDDKIVVVHNMSGDILYHGKWSSETYQDVFTQEGLYLYQVLVGGTRVSAGKIQVIP